MGCACSKGSSSVEVADKEFDKAEVAFIWPHKEPADSIALKSAALKDMLKKPEELKYEAGMKTVKTLEKGTYNTVWKVGSVKYLVPGTCAPTILRKILESDPVKNNLEKFGLDKLMWEADKDPQIEDLPDGNFKKALTTLEGLLPVNKWEIAASVEIPIGKYANHELRLTAFEKGRVELKEFADKPENQVKIARLKKKAAVEAAKMLLQELGISLDEILGNVFEVFGIDPPQVDLDAKLNDMGGDVLAPLSEDEKALIETGTHEFKSTALARYCVATQNTRVPVRYQYRSPGVTKALVRLWPFKKHGKGHGEGKAHGEAIEVALEPKKPEKEGKEAPKDTYECVVPLAPGRWAYQFDVDGKVFYSYGEAVPEGDTKGHYRVLEVAAVKPHFV